jgi:membrane protein
VERAAPDEPTQMPGKAWWPVLRRTFGEFQDDELTDRATRSLTGKWPG